MKEIIIPAMVAARYALSQEVRKLWTQAVWSIKQGQKRFFRAYKTTIDQQIPGWKDTWKTDPTFNSKLLDLEDALKAICLQNGMPRTTFKRYRQGARQTLLLGVPFMIVTSHEFTIEEARTIAQSDDPEQTTKEIRANKRFKSAVKQLRQTATVLPLPEGHEDPAEYIKDMRDRLDEHLNRVRERLGAEIVDELLIPSAPTPEENNPPG